MQQGTVTPGITRLIGNTPLLRIRMFERDFPRLEVYAKAQWFNPGGSVKDADVIAAADRLGLAMVFTGVRHFRH